MESFEENESLDQLDSAAFKFNHKLLGHPSLSMENLARVLPELPAGRVEFSKGLLNVNDDFEKTLENQTCKIKLEEIIENIRTSNSYIMVNHPDVHPSFAPIKRQLVEDVESIMRRLGIGKEAIDPRLFLFIASPNSVTPFHIDRYSNFLMQFRGSKHVSVFPQWDERAVTAKHHEAYMAYANTKLPFNDEIDALGTRFEFKPGEAIHIPFLAGHHVRNGSEDVSISMAIFFNTEQNNAWRKALRFNGIARNVLKKVGLSPAPVGQQAWRDKVKAIGWDAYTKIRELQTKNQNLFSTGLCMLATI
ncbi:MAG: transcriptional regulator [Gammaproteobacteria bacterium]|nr:MAG: transcriptional regulator [Gammaproteobacteria bacterium]